MSNIAVQKDGCGPYDARGKFDPYAWVALACIRGVRPVIVYQTGGQRAFCMSMVNDAGGPVNWLGLSHVVDRAELRAVANALIAMNRVIHAKDSAA